MARVSRSSCRDMLLADSVAVSTVIGVFYVQVGVNGQWHTVTTTEGLPMLFASEAEAWKLLKRFVDLDLVSVE